MARVKRSGADQKKKRSSTLRKIANALKIRKLQSKNKRGRVTSTTSKKMSNITGDTANKLRAESVYSTVKTKGGMSNLGKGYKQSEKKFSKFATEDSAQRNKAKYPKMGTYKGKDGKSVADEQKKSKSKSDLKTGSAREKLRAKNVKRFGKAHVDRLIAKNKEFQAAKKDKKKMKAYRAKYG